MQPTFKSGRVKWHAKVSSLIRQKIENFNRHDGLSVEIILYTRITTITVRRLHRNRVGRGVLLKRKIRTTTCNTPGHSALFVLLATLGILYFLIAKIEYYF